MSFEQLIELYVEEQAHGHVDVEKIIGDLVVACPERRVASQDAVKHHEYVIEKEEDRKPKDELHFLTFHFLDFAQMRGQHIFVFRTMN